MGAIPFRSSLIIHREFWNKYKENEMVEHNVHQIDLWLGGKISDAQLKSDIMEEPYEILPTEPWPRPEMRGHIICGAERI